MHVKEWKAALAAVPIYYQVILANSAMALTVIVTLIFFRTVLVAAAVVLGCGITNALLVRAAFQVEHHRRNQRQLLAWTLNESEKERLRVARQLQDHAAQKLAALMLTAGGNPAISQEAAAVMQDLCDTAQTLRPPGIEHLGLNGALSWYARSLERRFEVEIDLVIDPRLDGIQQPLALGIFRILEDLLATTAARTRGRIELFLSYTDGDVQSYLSGALDITANQRFRLDEWAAVLGGKVRIARHANITIVTVTVPIPEKGPNGGYDSRLAG